MRPDERDAAYIWDMLDSARTLFGFVGDISFYDYSRDKNYNWRLRGRWRSSGTREGVYPKNIDRPILKFLGKVS
jgi:hypothetical protein